MRLSSFATTTENVGRHLRLEELLSLWRQRPYWLPSDGGHNRTSVGQTPVMSKEDRSLWHSILGSAEPVPPRTALKGLQALADFYGLRIEQLAQGGAVVVFGSRAATNFGALRNATQDLQGYRWSLLVNATTLGVEASRCEKTLELRFRTVQRRGELLLAAEPQTQSLDSLGPLLMAAAADSSIDPAVRLWRIASALGVDEQFLATIDSQLRVRMGKAFAAELLGSAAELDVDTDGKLWAFSEGVDPSKFRAIRAPTFLPQSRLSILLEPQRALERMRSLDEGYYDSLARACTACADIDTLAELLRCLPIGLAFMTVSRTIIRLRPELIAGLVETPAAKAEGAFLALQLPARASVSSGLIGDLTDEWNEVQQLVRQQLVSTLTHDWLSLVAFGIHDEQLAERASLTSLVGAEPVVAVGSRIDPWGHALDGESGDAVVASVQSWLLSDRNHRASTIVFALRLCEKAISQSHRTTLARAVVDAYARSCAPHGDRACGISLATHGALLKPFRHWLGEDNEAEVLWRRWLRPFDVRSSVDQAFREQVSESNSDGLTQVAVVATIRAHAETLAAQADASDEIEQLLDAILELYFVDRGSRLYVQAFSWSSVLREGGSRRDPLEDHPLVRLGRVLGRSLHKDELLTRMLDERMEAHVLAYMIAGLGVEKSRSLVPLLRTLVGQLLADEGGVALGHVLELASVLLFGGLPREAERCARKSLEIVETFKDHQVSGFGELAAVLLATALVLQGDWTEVVALDRRILDRALAVELKYLRAQAHIKLEQFTEAKQLLDEVLAADSKHTRALSLLSSYFVHQKTWPEALEAANRAKAAAATGTAEWELAVVKEAEALEGLGDVRRAVFLRSLLLQRDESLAVVPKLLPEPVQSAESNDERVSVPSPEGVDVAIITALPEEYLAVFNRLLNTREPSSSSAFANTWQWRLGEVRGQRGNIKVALACCGRSGNPTAGFATLRSIDRFRPRYVLFSGIAGGLRRKGVGLGDVVLSETIWYYEYGKVDDGRFLPRSRETFSADPSLVNSGKMFPRATEGWKSCGQLAPVANHTPAFKVGTIASGDKVLDDLSQSFAKAILDSNSDIYAVEMEAGGACSAIRQALAERKVVGFAMVRSISDLPREGEDAEPLSPQSAPQSAQRDAWKVYASEAAAHFLMTWIASEWWPAA